GDEVLYGGEAVDVANLVEDRQGKGFTDPGYGLEQLVIARGDFFGLPLKFILQLVNLMVEVFDHGDIVAQRDLAQRMIFTGQDRGFPGGSIVTGVLSWGG